VTQRKLVGHGISQREPAVNLPADDLRAPGRELGPRSRAVRRFAPLIVVVALVALAYGLGLHRDVSFETFIHNRAAIDQLIGKHGLLAAAAYVALYIIVVGLSLPGGAIMTVTGGFLFGGLIGSVLACLGALAGATVVFLIARSAVGEFLTRRAGPFAAKLAEGFRADAFNYLLFLRLVPFPFWLVNLAPALFGVRVKTFVAATAIGILPATVTFAVFGAGLGSVVSAQESAYNACMAAGRSECSVNFDLSHVLTPTLLGALAALGVLALLPIVARKIWARRLEAGAPSKRR
jgi:uncharacterized membrane protein YdjX (TVP38/TMEM64 family)